MDVTQDLILGPATRLFEENCTDAELAAADAGEWLGDLWTLVEEFGLPLAMVAEEQGGIGIPTADAFALLRIAGARGAPLPLAETMIANRLLAAAGLEPLAGPATLAFADDLALVREGSAWRLRGTARRVPWARFAGVVAVAENEGRLFAVRLGSAALRVTPQANLAHEPRDVLHFDAGIAAADVAPLEDGTSAPDVLALLAAARCCLMAGAMEAILDMTVRYAGERQQFGRPIGKFQAVQQSMAVMAEQVAAALAASDLAVEAVSGTSPRLLAIAAAKLRAGEAAGIVAAIAHQVHGAIGFTHEYRLHYLTRRLWSWREESGNESHWAVTLGRALARQGPAGLWAAIAAA